VCCDLWLVMLFSMRGVRVKGVSGVLGFGVGLSGESGVLGVEGIELVGVDVGVAAWGLLVWEFFHANLPRGFHHSCWKVSSHNVVAI
jgi:hypothetical protein